MYSSEPVLRIELALQMAGAAYRTGMPGSESDALRLSMGPLAIPATEMS